jgi:hypothetical protein
MMKDRKKIQRKPFTYSFSELVDKLSIVSRKDIYGLPSCWNECIIESPVTILNTSQRKLYDNEPTKDGLGEFAEAKIKYTDGGLLPNSSDNEPDGLPF